MFRIKPRKPVNVVVCHSIDVRDYTIQEVLNLLEKHSVNPKDARIAYDDLSGEIHTDLRFWANRYTEEGYKYALIQYKKKKARYEKWKSERGEKKLLDFSKARVKLRNWRKKSLVRRQRSIERKLKSYGQDSAND